MSWTVAILVLAGLFAAVTYIAYASRQRDPEEHPTDQPQAVDAERSDLPEPGQPSPLRDGQPVPGSEADRNRHGKP